MYTTALAVESEGFFMSKRISARALAVVSSVVIGAGGLQVVPAGAAELSTGAAKGENNTYLGKSDTFATFSYGPKNEYEVNVHVAPTGATPGHVGAPERFAKSRPYLSLSSQEGAHDQWFYKDNSAEGAALRQNKAFDLLAAAGVCEPDNLDFAGECYESLGTVTLTFDREVTDPILDVTGIGGIGAWAMVKPVSYTHLTLPTKA